MSIEKIKTGGLYKLMKSTEAVAMVVLPVIFTLLGWFDLYPTIALVGIYIIINLTGYNDKALWQTRDRIVDSAEDIKIQIDNLKDQIKELSEKLEKKS